MSEIREYSIKIKVDQENVSEDAIRVICGEVSDALEVLEHPNVLSIEVCKVDYIIPAITKTWERAELALV